MRSLVLFALTEGFVGGDAENPCGERHVAVEFSDVAEHAQECFLHGVFGVVVQHCDAPYVPVDRFAVAAHEHAESRLGVATDGVEYGVVVGGRHAVGAILCEKSVGRPSFASACTNNTRQK